VLLVIFGVVWLIERKKKLGDPDTTAQVARAQIGEGVS
jgi:hypothetical protein